MALNPTPTITTPNPDPTVLTTAQLLREIGTARELVETKVAAVSKAVSDLETLVTAKAYGNHELILSRIASAEKAIEFVTHHSTEKLPELISEAITTLKDLHDEKFSSVETQFVERDKRTEQLSLADKTAIAAALQAQKEAAGATTETNSLALNKIEITFSKLIEQLQNLMQSDKRNADERLNDLKSRFDRGEGRTSISDPVVNESLRVLTTTVQSLRDSREHTTGKSEGISVSMAIIIAIVTLVFGGVAAVGWHSTTTSAPSQPQVIYVPSVAPSVAPTLPK